MSSFYYFGSAPGGGGGGSFPGPYLPGNGSAGAPTYSFASASNTGWYYDSVNSTLAASVNGTEIVQISDTANSGLSINRAPTVAALTVQGTSTNDLERWYSSAAALVSYINSTGSYYAPNGAAATPSYSFANATNYGWFYDSGATTLSAAANGVEAIWVAKDTGSFGLTGFGAAPLTGNTVYIKGQDAGGATYPLQVVNSSAANIFQVRSNGLCYASFGFQALGNGNTSNPAMGMANGNGIYADTTAYLSFAAGGAFAGHITNTQLWSGVKWQVASKTANYTVTVTESQTYYDNSGAAGLITYTLPTAALGMKFSFTSVNANQIKVTAGGSDAISMYANSKAAGGSITGPLTTPQGSSVTMVCTSANMWSVIAAQGTWS